MFSAALRFLLGSVLLLLLVAHPALSETLSGRVVAVADGDALTVLTEALEQVRVRVREIDTPECRQPYGQRSRERLSELAFGKQVQVAVRDRDRFGRTVGWVWADGVDVNALMVREGAAWVYRRYSQDEALRLAEDEARAARRGLWGYRKRSAPWEWRAAERRSRAQ